jgi:hypothetical protein
MRRGRRIEENHPRFFSCSPVGPTLDCLRGICCCCRTRGWACAVPTGCMRSSLSANRSQASAMWERATRASRSRNSAAISRHCCARRRYSSALPTTATLAPFVRYLTNADEGNWFDQLGQNARTALKKRTPLGSKGKTLPLGQRWWVRRQAGEPGSALGLAPATSVAAGANRL